MKLGTNKETRKAPQAVGIYFFHPDHLGSSTFLTDGSGNPYQMLAFIELQNKLLNM